MKRRRSPLSEEDDNFWAVGIDKGSGMIKTVAQGGYDFAKRSAAYFRSIGYSGVIMNEAEFKAAQARDAKAFHSAILGGVSDAS